MCLYVFLLGRIFLIGHNYCAYYGWPTGSSFFSLKGLTVWPSIILQLGEYFSRPKLTTTNPRSPSSLPRPSLLSPQPRPGGPLEPARGGRQQQRGRRQQQREQRQRLPGLHPAAADQHRLRAAADHVRAQRGGVLRHLNAAQHSGIEPL